MLIIFLKKLNEQGFSVSVIHLSSLFPQHTNLQQNKNNLLKNNWRSKKTKWLFCVFALSLPTVLLLALKFPQHSSHIFVVFGVYLCPKSPTHIRTSSLYVQHGSTISNRGIALYPHYHVRLAYRRRQLFAVNTCIVYLYYSSTYLLLWSFAGSFRGVLIMLNS